MVSPIISVIVILAFAIGGGFLFFTLFFDLDAKQISIDDAPKAIQVDDKGKIIPVVSINEDCEDGFIKSQRPHWITGDFKCIPIMVTTSYHANEEGFEPMLYETIEGRVIQIDDDSANVHYLTLETNQKYSISHKSDSPFKTIEIDDVVVIGHYDYRPLECFPYRIGLNNGTSYWFIGNDYEYGTWSERLDINGIETKQEMIYLFNKFLNDGSYDSFGSGHREHAEDCEHSRDYQLETINDKIVSNNWVQIDK